MVTWKCGCEPIGLQNLVGVGADGLPKNPLDYNIWWELEQMACQKRYPNVESLKHVLVKAAAEFQMAKICESIDDWPGRLRLGMQAKGSNFEGFPFV